MPVTFGLLGEIDAKHNGRSVDLGPPQQRALLGLLLLAGSRTVPLDEVVERMWGPCGEKTLRSTVRTYVVRLRRAFADVGVTSPPIETHSRGYRLVACGSTDLDVFTEHLTLGRAARDSGDLTTASQHHRTALRQWRGSALSGARAFFVDAERSRLNDLRITAVEERIQLDLESGHGQGLECELLSLVEQYPLRERLHESLMLAHYHNGRQADALNAYQRICRTLNDELGIAPGKSLREMHLRILRADPTLPRTPTTTATHRPSGDAPAPGHQPQPSSPRPGPNQLPTDTPDFTGRGETAARLLANLTGDDNPVTVGISGLDGAGKTSLAVHVAHLAKHCYPDGQFYADLHGEDGLDRVGDLLGQFLRALGIHAPLPCAAIERALLWRSCLAQRRVLTVIDDVANVDQVRLLSPATAGSGAIVTSIRNLEARAVHWEQATPLTPSESTALFDKIVGEHRSTAHSALRAGLTTITGGHPQFVRAVAHRILDRPPNWPPEDIVTQICDTMNTPTGINPDCRQMRRSIERSLELVGREISTAFRLIAVAQVSEFTPESVAALLDTTQTWSTGILHELADVHLLQRDVDRTFSLINVVKAYGRALARETDESETLRASLNRMRLFYKESEKNANVALASYEKPFGAARQTQVWRGLKFSGTDNATRWLKHNKNEIPALTDQLLLYSPAHAPVITRNAINRSTMQSTP